MNDRKRCDNRMKIASYGYDRLVEGENMTKKIPPHRKEPDRSGLDDNIHNEVMTCGNCVMIERSGRYKGLFYCSMGVAVGGRQRECAVDPLSPGCDWWCSTIPPTKEELDRLHRLAFGMPRDH